MRKFSIGQPVRRREDQRFITGAGCYLDDIAMPGMAHAAFVRSPHAHARILSIDVDEARAAPGVIAVFTHEDVERAGLGTFPTLDQVDGVDENGISVPPRYALTGGIARFVGDPVAMVVAETDDEAREAADLVMVDYEDLARRRRRGDAPWMRRRRWCGRTSAPTASTTSTRAISKAPRRRWRRQRMW